MVPGSGGWKKKCSITSSCKTSPQSGDKDDGLTEGTLQRYGQILSLDFKRILRATICCCQSWSRAHLNPCDNVAIFLKDLFNSGKYTPAKINVAWKFVHKSPKLEVKDSSPDLDYTSVKRGIFSSWELVWILRSSWMAKNKSDRFPDLNSVGDTKFPNTPDANFKLWLMSDSPNKIK